MLPFQRIWAFYYYIGRSANLLIQILIFKHRGITIEVKSGDARFLDQPQVRVKILNLYKDIHKLALKEVPKKLVLIAGYIGLEIGSVWGQIGT